MKQKYLVGRLSKHHVNRVKSTRCRAKEIAHKRDHLYSSIYEVAEGHDEAGLTEMPCIALSLVTRCMQLFKFTKPNPENSCAFVYAGHTATQHQLLLSLVMK